jgi:hypothetical protein
MPEPVPLTEVLVSVQDAEPEHRHLAPAVLGDNDLVLVPSPPRELLDPDRAFDVVTIPMPLEAGYLVERLRARCANVMWVGERRGRPVAAMLKLDQASRYSRTMGPFHGATLAAELARNEGDLWSALEGLGIVRRGLREGPPAEVLGALPDVERAQRRVTYRDHEYPDAGEIGWSICRWLCICQTA